MYGKALGMAAMIRELGQVASDPNDLVRGFLESSLQTMLQAEMDAHLGDGHGDRDAKQAAGTTNHRNGSYERTVESTYGPVTVSMPRDRQKTFESRLLARATSEKPI